MQYMIYEKCGDCAPVHMTCESYENAREIMIKSIANMEDIYNRDKIVKLIENDRYESSDGSYVIYISDREVEPGKWEPYTVENAQGWV